MNKKLKCLLSAVLVLVMLTSVAIAMPTAAESDDDAAAAQTAVTETPAAPQTEDANDVFSDGKNDLEEIAATGASADAETSADREIAETGDNDPVEPDLDTDLNTFRKGSYTNRIVLKWRTVRGVDGYRVYWRDMLKKGTEFKLLTKVKDSSLTIRNLKPGSKYRITVRAYIVRNGKTVEGKISRITAATAPSGVKNLRLTSAASTKTGLKWSRNTDADGYLVYRQHNGEWKEIKRLSAKTTSLVDTDVIAGHLYCYKVMAVRDDTRGSQRGAVATINVVCGMCAPADTGSTSRGNRVYLVWRDNPYATGYQVYYSTDNKTYKGLTDTADNTASTKKFKEGTRVYFRVRPYRIVGAKKIKVLGTVSQFSVKVLANSFGADVGSTYVEIDISEQHLWYVKNGDVFVSTPVVTGNNNSMDTPRGIFSIRSKARNVSLVGAGYVSFVEYWLPFIGSSYGIHDASWRSSFGGEIYKGNGSHGCVNTPYDAVKKIYNNISVGTPVVIHG